MISVDTNVLVYVQDGRDPVKRDVAESLFTRLSSLSNTLVGLQVLGELYTVLTRKLEQDPATARQAVGRLLHCSSHSVMKLPTFILP